MDSPSCSPSTAIRRSVGSQSGRDFPSARLWFLLCLGIDQSALSPAPASKASLCRTLSPLLQRRVEAFASACHAARSDRSDASISRALQLAATPSRTLVPQRATLHRSSPTAPSTSLALRGRSRPLARSGAWTSLYPPCWGRWLCHGGWAVLLCRAATQR